MKNYMLNVICIGRGDPLAQLKNFLAGFILGD